MPIGNIEIDYYKNPQPYMNSKELWDKKIIEEEKLYQRINNLALKGRGMLFL